MTKELEGEKGGMVTDEKNFLEKIEVFYKDLYFSKINAFNSDFNQCTHDINFPQLPDDEQDQQEVPWLSKNARQFLTYQPPFGTVCARIALAFVVFMKNPSNYTFFGSLIIPENDFIFKRGKV